jgi:putative DNA primase/helicase
LRWAIEGCLEWQIMGLAPPDCVRVETDWYFDGQDLLGQWLDEHCIVEPGSRRLQTPIRTLYTSWARFSREAGQEPASIGEFGAELDKRGLLGDRKRIGGKQTRVRIGIALRECVRTEMKDDVTEEDSP